MGRIREALSETLEAVNETMFPGLLAREAVPVPLEGTNNSLWPQIADFWDEMSGSGSAWITPPTAARIWVAQRCMQLNSQQIASMPLRFSSTAEGGGREPAWLSNPDPNWYPNGIGDAVFAAVRNIYAWGFVCLRITSRYSDGFPSAWTVLPSSQMVIEEKNGRRTYKIGEVQIPAGDIIQIDRDPSDALHGMPAISAYASQSWGLLAGSELNRSVLTGGVPQVALKSKTRKLDSTQAAAVQAQWVRRTQERGGAPPVLPPELDFEKIGMSPADLLLLDGLNFNARVIAGAYGVPPFLLNLTMEGGLTYQNPAMLGEMWWRFELRPRAKQFADALTAQALPRGNWVTFDASDTFAPIGVDQTSSEEDDTQLSESESQVASATPAQQNGAPVLPIRATLGGTG